MVGSQCGGKNSMSCPSFGSRPGSMVMSRPCSSPAQEYSTPGHSTASGTKGRSVEKALKPPSTIAISAVGTLTTVVSTVSAISKSS